MRIALVVHQFLPEHIGGTEVYTWTLGKALMAKGHQVDLFVPRAGARALSAASFDGLTVWSAPSPAPNENAIGAYRHAFRNRRIERAYTRFLRLVRPDVVHIQHLQHVSARIVALSKPIPTVVTLHDYWYLCPNSQLLLPDRSLCDGPRGGWRCAACGLHRAGVRLPKALQALAAPPFAWRYHVVWRALREADCLIAPSDFVRQVYLGQGIAPECLHVIPHGLDTTRFASIQRPTGARRGDGLRFGFLGSIAWQKGPHVLIEAFNALPPDASLTIYGNLDAFPDYVATLRALARHSGIRFAGAIPPEQVGRALSELDCLIVPSLWHETFCLVIQEANAVGVPAVASDLGALPERVGDGVTGRLFPVGDVAALRAILEELVTRPEMLDLWRRNLEPPLSVSEHAERVVAVYRAAGASTAAG